jgi:hypothetical protein
MKRLVIVFPALILAFALLCVITAAPSFAFGLNSFETSFGNADGTGATQAGSHPFSLETSFGVNTRETAGVIDVESELKGLTIEQITGLVGDPTAVPRCTSTEFLTAVPGVRNSSCPNDTAVGTAADVIKKSNEGENFYSPVFNLTPANGSVVRLGFLVFTSTPVILEVGIGQGFPYRVRAKVTNAPQLVALVRSNVTIWGVPADPRHDEFRGSCIEFHTVPPKLPFPEIPSQGMCPANVPEAPFLTLPRACTAPLTTDYLAEFWQPLGAEEAGESAPFATTGCQSLGFAPTIEAKPTTHTAESSSGLDFDLNVENPGLTDVDRLADSDIEKAVVTLPPGITTNSSVATGLGACTFSQYESESLQSEPGSGCPESSKVGEVEVETPLLEEEGGGLTVIHGSLYVAKQHDNPFNDLLTIYIVIKDPKLGILISQAGKVEPDPVTGQLTTTFDQLPQLPFSHFHLRFAEGKRAPLITPATCGSYETQATLYPYDHDLAPVEQTASFQITSGAGGSSCVGSMSELPNAPGFSAGTVSSIAGSYSPFILSLNRTDGSQQFSRIKTTLPSGLLAKLAGVPYCPESGIDQADSRSGEGEGALEVSSPSCPQSSEVGTVTVAAGAGSEPLYVNGHAYLAGPYKGAPLSLEIITPAIAGPFDLGVVAVRAALQVDPLTAEVTAESDPIPTILHGLPLDVRGVSLNMERPSFTLNPTSCEPKAITGQVASIEGAVAPLSQYFQAQACAALKFKPTLKLTLGGQTKRTGHPSLRAVLTYPKGAGYANIGRAQVALPHSEFLDQANLNKTCTKPLLLAGECPAKSIYGRAKVFTPLLDKPLEGPVYLVGGFGYELPALVAELGGQIRVLLVGKVDSAKDHGIRNTFEAVPDAPVDRFELMLKGGPKYSLLENSENLCLRPQKAQTTFVAQSGVRIAGPVTIRNSCGKGKAKKANPGRKQHRRHRRSAGEAPR